MRVILACVGGVLGGTLHLLLWYSSCPFCTMPHQTELSAFRSSWKYCVIFPSSWIALHVDSSLIAWYAMCVVNLAGASFALESCWLPQQFVWGLMSSLPGPDREQVVVYGQDTFVDVSAVTMVLLIQYRSTCYGASFEAAKYLHWVHDTPIPDSFSDTHVLLSFSPLCLAIVSGSKVTPVVSAPMEAASSHYFDDIS